MAYLMGIDLGTSSVKVLITDEAGHTMASGQCSYEVETPQYGYAEQQPETWWKCTRLAVTQAMARSGVKPEEVEGIGLSGQMHGLVALDASGHPVCPAIIHLDQRSLEERDIIAREAGELLRTELMNRPATGMLICSLLWLKKNRTHIYEKIVSVMSPKDYIRYRLTGRICTDPTDAGAALAYSVRNGSWCEALLQRLQLETGLWPQVCGSAEVTGHVCRQAAEETGLSVKTAVVTGCGDCAAQLTGNGVIRPGILSCNIGTASQLAVITDHPVADPTMSCQLWCHSVPGRWIWQGGAMNGGNTISWLRSHVLKTDKNFAQLDAEAGQVPPGCEGLIFLPYLAGERTPWNNPLARGVYFGLGLRHDQPWLVRAAMEGVVCNLSLCKKIFDQMGITPEILVSAGGGARGSVWRQIQADMLNLPIRTTETEEEACLGAAILAAVGTGKYRNVLDACQAAVHWNPQVTEPIPENVKIYEEYQQIYSELYQSLEPVYEKTGVLCRKPLHFSHGSL